MQDGPAPDPGAKNRTTLALVIACIAACGLFIQFRTHDVPFLLDDLTAAAILHPDGPFDGDGARRMLWPDAPQDSFHGHFRPVGWASVILDDLVLGLRAERMRSVAIVIHGASALLLACLVLTLFGKGAGQGAACAATFFMLSPAAGEPVIWICHRFTLLAVFFFLASALAAARLARTGKGAILLGLAVCLALLSKESMYTAVWSLPIFATLIASRGARLAALKSAGLAVVVPWVLVLGVRRIATGTFFPTFSGARDVVAGFDLGERIANVPAFLRFLVVPIPAEDGWNVACALTLSLLIGILLLASLRRRRSWRAPALALFVLVLGALLPTLHVGSDLEGSRRLYLPGACWFLVLAGWIHGRLGVLAWVAAATLILPTWRIQGAYREAGMIVEQATSAIEEAEGRAPGGKIRVTGLPATWKSAPLFGTDTEHLPIRFRPPLRGTALDVLGVPHRDFSTILDGIEHPTTILGMLVDAEPYPAAAHPRERWRITPSDKVPVGRRIVQVAYPLPKRPWSGDRLTLTMPARGTHAPRRWFLEIRVPGLVGRAVIACPEPAKDTGGWTFDLSPLNKDDARCLSPGALKLVSLFGGTGTPATLFVQAVGDLRSDALGCSSPVQSIILGRAP